MFGWSNSRSSDISLMAVEGTPSHSLLREIGVEEGGRERRGREGREEERDNGGRNKMWEGQNVISCQTVYKLITLFSLQRWYMK